MSVIVGKMQYHPYNGKIADINESDTNKHTVDISAYVPTNCVAVVIVPKRVSGSGELYLYSNEGSTYVYGTSYNFNVLLAIKNQRIQFHQSTANDDFDLYMLGYLTD